jgi:hypothetical protein
MRIRDHGWKSQNLGSGINLPDPRYTEKNYEIFIFEELGVVSWN